MLQTIDAAEGTVPIVGPAPKLSRTPTRVRTPAPALGAHNDEILAELGRLPGRRAASSSEDGDTER